MLSKSPLIWNTAFHTPSSWKKTFYSELKNVILKRYWIALPRKIERLQRNKVHKEGPFQPWTTCSSDNDHAPSEMQSGSSGRRNSHLDHSLIQECGILSKRLVQKRPVWPRLSNTDVTRCTWRENQTCRSTQVDAVMQGTALQASCSPRTVNCGLKRCFLETLVQG